MASEKVASVKLKLDGSSYVSELKNLGRQNEDTARKVESVWKTSAVAGLKAARSELGSMVSSVKSTINMVAGLGGSFTLAGAVKGALDLRSEFKQIAVEVREGSGQIVDFNLLMKDAQEQAAKWGLSTKDLGDAMRRVRDETGDLDFARESMKAIAMTSRASGESIEVLATIAGKLGEKFGVAAKDMPEALATVMSLAKQGGIQMDDMAGAIDRVGSSAKSAGISGVDGFARMIGMANLAKGDAKNIRGALMGVMAITDEMAKGDFGTKLQRQFGVATKELKDGKLVARDFQSVLGDVLKKTGGRREQLSRVFEGEQLKIVTDLGNVFRETFEHTSGSVKTKTAAALAAYQAHLKDASKAQINAAEMGRLAAERATSPAAQMQRAMEKLTAAFTRPEMMDGLLKLAEIAPKAADRLAKLMEFAFEHPAMAAGIFAGLKLGAPFIQGALVEGMKAAGPGLAKVLGDAFRLPPPPPPPPVPPGALPGAGAATSGAAAFTGGGGITAAGVAGFVALPVLAAAGIAAQASYRMGQGERQAGAAAADTVGTPEGRLANLRALAARAEAARAAAQRVREGGENQYLPQNKALFDTEALGMVKALPELAAAIATLTKSIEGKAGEIKNVDIEGPGGGAYRGPLRPGAPGPGYNTVLR